MKKTTVLLLSVLVVCCFVWSVNIAAEVGKLGEKIDITKLKDLPEMSEELEESKPIVVTEDADVFITKKYITTDEIAVVVADESDVFITDCYIVAGDVAIKVLGSGNVVIKKSVILGGVAAVLVDDVGDAVADGTTFIGSLVISDNGDFTDEGDNTFEKLEEYLEEE